MSLTPIAFRPALLQIDHWTPALPSTSVARQPEPVIPPAPKLKLRKEVAAGLRLVLQDVLLPLGTGKRKRERWLKKAHARSLRLQQRLLLLPTLSRIQRLRVFHRLFPSKESSAVVAVRVYQALCVSSSN